MRASRDRGRPRAARAAFARGGASRLRRSRRRGSPARPPPATSPSARLRRRLRRRGRGGRPARGRRRPRRRRRATTPPSSAPRATLRSPRPRRTPPALPPSAPRAARSSLPRSPQRDCPSARRRRYNVRMRWLALLLALLVPAVARAGDGGLQAVKQRYLPAAQASYSNTPDGAQARYDAGRDLVEAVVAVGRVGTSERAFAPTCLRAAALRWRGRRRSTATTASAASLRSRRCRWRARASARACPIRRWHDGSPRLPQRRTAPSGSGCTT